MYNCTDEIKASLQIQSKACQNTTTRHIFSVKLIILHLLTAHILHVFYNYSYEAKKPSLRALQVNCIAFDGPTGLHQCTSIPNQKKLKLLKNKNRTIKKIFHLTDTCPTTSTSFHFTTFMLTTPTFRRWGSHHRCKDPCPKATIYSYIKMLYIVKLLLCKR